MNEAEAMATSIWACMASWFTPTILFCFVNLVIGTIFLTSNLKKPQHEHQLVRTPSLLERVKSIKFPFHRSEEFQTTTQFPDPSHEDDHIPDPTSNFIKTQHEQYEHQLVRTPSLLERVKSLNFSFSRSEEFPTTAQFPYPYHEDEHIPDPRQEVGDHVGFEGRMIRSKSEKSEEAPAMVETKIKKSASEKEIVRERRGKLSETTSDGEDETVDAKADDFIDRFRKHLSLQRLDSLRRWTEMLTRGSEK